MLLFNIAIYFALLSYWLTFYYPTPRRCQRSWLLWNAFSFIYSKNPNVTRVNCLRNNVFSGQTVFLITPV